MKTCYVEAGVTSRLSEGICMYEGVEINQDTYQDYKEMYLYFNLYRNYYERQGVDKNIYIGMSWVLRDL